MNKKFIVTIGRQYGSGGREIGKRLAEKLGVDFYDKELITLAAKKHGMSEKVFESVDENRQTACFTVWLSVLTAWTAVLRIGERPYFP